MPRKSRKKAQAESPSTEPTPVAEILEQSPALAAILASREAKASVEPETPMPVPETGQQPGAHSAAVLSSRPHFLPVPANFKDVFGNPIAGIRVNKSFDRRFAAIQFAENRLPTRAEKDVLEAVGKPQDGTNFVYHTQRRQWERETPPGMELGENVIDAVRIAKELARGREGISR